MCWIFLDCIVRSNNNCKPMASLQSYQRTKTWLARSTWISKQSLCFLNYLLSRDTRTFAMQCSASWLKKIMSRIQKVFLAGCFMVVLSRVFTWFIIQLIMMILYNTLQGLYNTYSSCRKKNRRSDLRCQCQLKSTNSNTEQDNNKLFERSSWSEIQIEVGDST